MDISEYMPMFLAEAREHLQELNLAIIRLEENHEDRATVDEVFRIAHSLKGMSATMGFPLMAELTHEMEDVFELLRQRTAGLEVEAIDTVFACLDVLSGAVDAIELDGQERLEPAILIERLRHLVRSGDPDGEHATGPGAVDAAPATPPAIEVPDGARVLVITATLSEEAPMPAVRALMLLTALGDHGELIRSEPPIDSLEGFQNYQVKAWLVSQHEQEEVAASARAVTDVTAVELTEEDRSERPPEPAQDALVLQLASEAPPDTHGSTPAARTVRVDAERLDMLMHSMGELVIHRTAVEALSAGLDVPGLQQAVQDLTRSSQSLQSMVMQVRMIPVDIVFLRFPRLVRDLAAKLGKEVELRLVGKETEMDRTVVDALGDPLVHLVRNALDHGIEAPEERLAAGKPRVGIVEIAARHAGGSVIIEVRDDGNGIDSRAVARKALAAGLIDPEAAASLDARGAVELLFTPGFSTVETATDISGRGVGMDAVRAQIRELGGEVVMESTLGGGTHAQIRLPLTLAIVAALQVEIGGAPYAIPLDRVERTLRLSQHMVRTVAGRRVVVLEDGVLPLLEGAETFARGPHREHDLVVIVRGEDRRLGLAVDELIGQRELVTRPLPSVAPDCEPVSGGAVLADGRIALIVDCDALASRIVSRAPTVSIASTPALRRAA